MSLNPRNSTRFFFFFLNNVTYLITEKVCSGVKIGSDVSLWSDNIQHFQVTLMSVKVRSSSLCEKRPSSLPKDFQRNVCTMISVCERQTYSQLRLCCCKPKQMLHRPPVNAANTARPPPPPIRFMKANSAAQGQVLLLSLQRFPMESPLPL